MSSQCKPSCTPSPSQWQRHHAIQTEASCITSSNRRRLFNGIPFQRRRVQERSGNTEEQESLWQRWCSGGTTKESWSQAHRWLLTMLNKCFMENNIPTLWRQSKIIAILKPGKDSVIPKSYRPISLLCHTYKLYEIMILTRIAPTIEQHLIKEQAGFRPGKSCTSQLLNLTHHIEDGYQEGMITGIAFVDMSAAYDTANHRL